RYARNRVQFRPQPVDDLVRRGLSLIQGLERDERAAGIGCGAAASSRKRLYRRDTGVLLHNTAEPRNLALHGLERRVLVGDKIPIHAPGVFLRKEALRDN